MSIRHVYNDGGRAAAGRRGNARDCVTRAISIATGMDYSQAYELVNDTATSERRSKRRCGKSAARTGVYGPTTRRIMAGLDLDPDHEDRTGLPGASVRRRAARRAHHRQTVPPLCRRD